MKKGLALLFAVIGWGTLIARLTVRIQTEDVPAYESVIRFLSYFTILSNLLVTIFFTVMVVKPNGKGFWHRPGTLTALAAIMTFVGIIYHITLRPVWNPEGFDLITSEIHHTLVPLGTILFWYLYENKGIATFSELIKWLIYPITYIAYVLVRGSLSDFYPYYFLDISTMGLGKVLINSMGLFAVISLFLFIYHLISKRLKG